MRAHQRLVLLAGASGAVLILLGHMAHRAAERLLEVPPQSWGLSELSDAIVAGTCAFGILGALWHVISALLALMTLPRADGPGSLRRGGASTLAARLLEAWGAPAVRRITASALLVSLSSPPRGPPAGTTSDGTPPARRPPPHRRSPRRRRLKPTNRLRRRLPGREPPSPGPRAPGLQPSRPLRALRAVPAPRTARASQRSRPHRAAPGRSPPPAPTPRPRRHPPTPSCPARACGRSPPAFCPPDPAPNRSRRPGRSCIAPTPTSSAPTRH